MCILCLIHIAHKLNQKEFLLKKKNPLKNLLGTGL